MRRWRDRRTLGGYTTFSAFADETHFLAREEAWMSATLSVVAQVGLGLLAVVAGHRLAIAFTS